MKKLGMLTVCVALVAAGCDDGRDDVDGGIVLMDSGPEADSGPADAGPVDAGPVCTLGPMGLSMECFPRCSGSTASAINACTAAGGTPETIGMCQQEALEADTTMSITVEGTSLDCAGCAQVQQLSCVVASCGVEFQACQGCADGCNPATAGCESEETAFNTCQMTNMSTIQTCVNARVTECFDL